MKEVVDKKTLKSEQLKFINENKKCASNFECLKKNYISRTLKIHYKAVDLGRYLESRKWAPISTECLTPLTEFTYTKEEEILILELGCKFDNFGILYDIRFEKTKNPK